MTNKIIQQEIVNIYRDVMERKAQIMSEFNLDQGILKVINPDKVAIYIRWSTDEQSEGNTLSMQLESCKRYIESQGWDVNENLIYIDDGWSGSNLDRPSMKKLRKDVKKGLVDCVIVWKIDRLSRSIVDTVDLVLKEWKYNCYVKSVNEPFDTSTPMGVLVLSILAIFAEMERETIRFRTFSGKVKNIQDKGKSPGIRFPYGYTGGAEPGTFKVVEEESEIVRRIFREYINGDGRVAIAHRLNREGIPFTKGRHWSESTLARILSNPLYTGKLVWGKTQTNPKRNQEGEKRLKRRENPIIKQLSEDVLIPIISPDDFETVRKIRQQRDVFKDRRTSGRAFTSQYLLSGLVRCAKCGHSFTVRKQPRDTYAYYYCQGKRLKGTSFCECGHIRQVEIDKLVIDQVKKTFLTGETETNLLRIIAERYETTLHSLQLAQTSLETKLKQLEAEHAKVYKDYRKGDITAKDFNLLKVEIENEQIETKTQLTSAKKELEELTSKGIDSSDIRAFAHSLSKWEELSLSEQKNLLHKWIDHIEMYKTIGRKENVHLKIFFKTMLDTKDGNGKKYLNGEAVS